MTQPHTSESNVMSDPHPLDDYRPSPGEAAAFGKYWCFPTGLNQRAEPVLCAVYPASGGYPEVKVYRKAYPAVFYTLEVAGGPTIGTGTVGADWAADMAELINMGMLMFEGGPPMPEPERL